MITPENLIRHEFIGLIVEVMESTNRSQVGLKGKVVDESRQTISIRTEKGVKNIVKDQCVLAVVLPNGERVAVDGKLLVARPEDRTKKKQRKW